MDWMTQGTRITGNLLHDNEDVDFFIEVNHGPFVIDNNILLSKNSLRDWSQGGAYVHNLFTGNIGHKPTHDRKTPFHHPHSTMIAGYKEIQGGDSRFFNNIFTGSGLSVYDNVKLPLLASGNLYLNGALPYSKEESFVKSNGFDPKVAALKENEDGIFISLDCDVASIRDLTTQIIGTHNLGKALVPDLPYKDYDTSQLKIDKDYFGLSRNAQKPTPGPFEKLRRGVTDYKVR